MSSVRGLLLVVAFHLSLVSGQIFETTHGRVKGKRITVLDKPLDVFHGIPFAKPPVGDLRFKHPQPAEPWGPNVKDATVEKPACIQSTVIYGFMTQDDPRKLPVGISEDCLYLSIWKPSNATRGSNLAVMVWIYGGGFTQGSTALPLTSGQYLAAENDVIVVSINYRLGPLGFLYLGPDTIPGNMGMMDQVKGMEWVKNNIENFGGDTKRITIFGESAGAFSVGYHLLSPLSRDLFNNAILQSGFPVNNVLQGLMSPKDKARDNVKMFAQIMKCPVSSDADMYYCLRDADIQNITSGSETLAYTGALIYPVVERPFLPFDPMTVMKREEYKKTNILAGVTKDEATGLYSFYLNPLDQVIYTTGEKFSRKHFEPTVTLFTQLYDKERIQALKVFYESERSPPLDYLEILTDVGSDTFFKCPAQLFSSLYSKSNNVYLYSLNYRMSTMPFPEWMGVPHGFDMDLLFGLPLNNTLGFNDQDREVSRNMMKYWTNFAKSGNPNLPIPVESWPAFNIENLTYMALDVGSNLATRHGFRRHQCAFVNHILPLIPKDEDIMIRTTIRPDYPWTSGSEVCSGSVFAVSILLTLSARMLQ